MAWRPFRPAAARAVARAHREDRLPSLLPLAVGIRHQVCHHAGQGLGDEPPAAAQWQGEGQGLEMLAWHTKGSVAGLVGCEPWIARGQRGECTARTAGWDADGRRAHGRLAGCGRSLHGVRHARLQAARRRLELLKHVVGQLLGVALLRIPRRRSLATRGRAGDSGSRRSAPSSRCRSQEGTRHQGMEHNTVWCAGAGGVQFTGTPPQTPGTQYG